MYVFKDFKGFADARLNLFQPLTVLIGPNGSGKSNVIEGVELLSAIAHGRPLYEISDVGRGGNGVEIRGGLMGCPRFGHTAFELGFGASVKFEQKARDFTYSVVVKPAPRPRIASERLSFDDGTLIFETISAGWRSTSADVRVQYNNFARGTNPIVSVSSSRSILSQYKEFAKNNKKTEDCFSIVDAIQQYLRSSFVFDPDPKKMRHYERIHNHILARNGVNLSPVLYNLSIGNVDDKTTLDRLLNWIRQLPEERYNDFFFVKTEVDDVLLSFRETADSP